MVFSFKKIEEIYQKEKIKLYKIFVDMELFWYYMYSISDVKILESNLFFMQLNYFFQIIKNTYLSNEIIFKILRSILKEISKDELLKVKEFEKFSQGIIDFLCNKIDKARSCEKENLNDLLRQKKNIGIKTRFIKAYTSYFAK